MARHARDLRWRLPLLMFLSIVGAANYYLLDGLVGWLFAAIGLGLAALLGRLRAHLRLARSVLVANALRRAAASQF